jgi:unsaturated rhamnogalacturonyl hydrolase
MSRKSTRPRLDCLYIGADKHQLIFRRATGSTALRDESVHYMRRLAKCIHESRIQSKLVFLLVTAAACAGAAQPLAHKVILLDAYHNQETKQPSHYRWEATDNGGFSDLGNLLRGMRAELKTTTEEITSAALAGIDCLIIVDPDTPSESDHPHYIGPSERKAIVDWVNSGGRLVLLGNNEGNAEFQHFNELARMFGFIFEDSTIGKNGGRKAILTLTGRGSIFDGAPVFYAVDVAPIKVESKAVRTLLDDKGVPVMVLVRKGRGSVFGLGDPWIYNEYIHRHDNAAIAAKLFTMLLQ